MQATELGQLPWLAPTLGAFFAWGLAQGLVKKYIGEVSAASFCLYYAIANAVVNVAFWAIQDAPPAFAPEGQQFAFWGLLAYLLDGIAWIFYYQSLSYPAFLTARLISWTGRRSRAIDRGARAELAGGGVRRVFGDAAAPPCAKAVRRLRLKVCWFVGAA